MSTGNLDLTKEIRIHLIPMVVKHRKRLKEMLKPVLLAGHLHLINMFLIKIQEHLALYNYQFLDMKIMDFQNNLLTILYIC